MLQIRSCPAKHPSSESGIQEFINAFDDNYRSEDKTLLTLRSLDYLWISFIILISTTEQKVTLKHGGPGRPWNPVLFRLSGAAPDPCQGQGRKEQGWWRTVPPASGEADSGCTHPLSLPPPLQYKPEGLKGYVSWGSQQAAAMSRFTLYISANTSPLLGGSLSAGPL